MPLLSFDVDPQYVSESDSEGESSEALQLGVPRMDGAIMYRPYIARYLTSRYERFPHQFPVKEFYRYDAALPRVGSWARASLETVYLSTKP